MKRLLAAAPSLLGLILALYLALGALYALRTPAWQSPDEPAHFNYVRYLAEQGAFPVLQPGDYDHAYLEEIKARKFEPGLSIDSIRYEFHQPPLYYLAAAPVYLAARPLGQIPALLALRLFSLLLGVLVLFLSYRLLSEVCGESLIVLGAAGLMATVPMHLAMTAAANNDTLAELVLVGLAWLALRRVQGRLGDRAFILWGGVVYALALLTKTTTYLPGAALLLLAEVLRLTPSPSGARPRGLRLVPSLRVLLLLFGWALALSAPWFLRNMLTYGAGDPLGWARHDAVVAGQPTTAEWIARYGLRTVVFDFLAIGFKSFWAQFGWMGVLVNDRIYTALFLLTAAALLGLVLGAARLARQPGLLSPLQQRGLALAAAWLGLTLLSFAAYNLKFFQPQGRYLFPALLPLALFLVLGWRELVAPAHRKPVFLLVYLGLLALDYISLTWFIVPQLRLGG